MRDILEDIKEEHGRISFEYMCSRFLELRRYQADTISDFLQHREEMDRSSFFVMADPGYSKNPLEMGSYTHIVLVTFRGPYHYEVQEGANENLEFQYPAMRRIARETTLWLSFSEKKDPCLDMTPNAELTDTTGTLKVLSGLDVPSGRSMYSPTIAYHIKSHAIQILDGFFLKGNGKKRRRKREISGLELALR